MRDTPWKKYLLAWVKQNLDYAAHSAEARENSGRYLNLVVFQK